MSKSLYEEAVADAQKLRKLAEETAKNRVVEAVMPQIRDLVNRRILGEQDEEFEDLDATSELYGELPLEIDADVDIVPPPISMDSDASGAPVINVSAEGDVNIDVEPGQEESSDEFVLTDEMAEALGRLIRGESGESQRLGVIEEAVGKMKKLFETRASAKLTAVQKRKLNTYFNHCLKEALNLRNSVILNELSTQEKLEQRLTEVIKEMRDMSKSKRQNIFDFLFEQDGSLFEQDEELDVGEEVEAEEEAELEPVEVDPVEAGDALVDLGAVLGLDVSVGEEVEELDVEEEEVEVAGEEELAFEGDVYEIDESMLRRELSRMRRLREQEESDAADADPYLVHGGEEVGDVVLDVDEEDLINALADEVGDAPAPVVERARRSRRAPRRAPRRASRRPAGSRHMAEARRSVRQAQHQVAQYRNATVGMKKQLVEMNLFNAKLLYANKLMQNKNLTTKQQRAIVEALDNAKTLREAKLLYKSLSESLSRRTRGKNLNEGSLRTLGSSSRSTRSAQPASSGVEVDRWAVLAGIPGKE